MSRFGEMGRPQRRRAGLYVQIYPSTLENASRMLKIGQSVHKSVGFERTELVGVHRAGLAPVVELDRAISLTRVQGTAREGNLGRVLRVLLWQPRVFLRYWRRPVDVLACHNVWILPMCWLLAAATGAALVYNPHELETETFTMRGMKKRVAQIIERILVPRCALVSVVNAPIAAWYSEHYDIAEPVVVGNVPLAHMADVKLRQRLGVSDHEMLYVHTGHLTHGRNIPLILQAFERSSHHLLLLGDGPLRDEAVASAERAPTIHWLPPVDPDLVVAHMREADVGLCLIEGELDLSHRLSSPNKLMEALVAGTPALCSDLVMARHVLADWSTTWVLPDVARLPEALERITKSDVEAFRAGWSGVPSWDEEVQPLVAAYRSLLAPGRADTIGTDHRSTRSNDQSSTSARKGT